MNYARVCASVFLLTLAGNHSAEAQEQPEIYPIEDLTVETDDTERWPSNPVILGRVKCAGGIETHKGLAISSPIKGRASLLMQEDSWMIIRGPLQVAKAKESGEFNVQSATFSAKELHLASPPESSATAAIRGEKTLAHIKGPWSVGEQGSAILQISQGAQAVAESMTLGQAKDGIGILDLDDEMSKLGVIESLSVGIEGRGQVTQHGGSLFVDGEIRIGDDSFANEESLLQSSIEVTGGELRCDELTIHPKFGSLNVGGGFVACNLISVSDPKSLRLNGGTLKWRRCQGDLALGAGEVLLEGASEVTGDLQLTQSTVRASLLGRQPKRVCDSLVVGGQLTLRDCKLIVVTDDPSTLTSDQTFRLIDCSQISGEFSVTDLPQLSDGLEWDTSHLLSYGELRISASEVRSNESLSPQTLGLVASGALFATVILVFGLRFFLVRR